jgi:hypothetical protein
LPDDAIVMIDCSPYWGQHVGPASRAIWHYSPRTFHLRGNHIAYKALALGDEPWSGGDAPDDWNGCDVLLRNGKTARPDDPEAVWQHGRRRLFGRNGYEIIGYGRKPEAVFVEEQSQAA